MKSPLSYLRGLMAKPATQAPAAEDLRPALPIVPEPIDMAAARAEALAHPVKGMIFTPPFSSKQRHRIRCRMARLQRRTLLAALKQKLPGFGPAQSGVRVLANDGGSQYERDHEGQAVLDNALPDSALLINEATIDDAGWALIPFGDWPHEMGMQRFHRPEAEAIANAFNGMAGRIKRAITGLPIFKGHPDHPAAAIGGQYPDKADKGQIAAMEVRPNGLALKLVLSNAGADLVRKGWKFISPLWLGKPVGQPGASMTTYAPTELLSVGLVVKPNIPVPSLANHAAHAANPNQRKTMNPKILALLGLATDATPEQIESAADALTLKVTTLGNEASLLVTAKGELTALQGKVATLENAATAATTDLNDARTALANERKSRIAGLVADAIRTGRITEAEKATWAARLETNFEAEATVLANAAPKVKTASEIPAMLKQLEKQMTASLGNNGDGDEDDAKDACGLSNEQVAAMKPGERASKIKALVNEGMKQLGHIANSGHRYDTAYGQAKRANPRLFGLSLPKTQAAVS